MALHGSLVAAVLLGHRNIAPLEGQARVWGRLLGKKRGVLPRPPVAPSLLPSGRKHGTGRLDSPGCGPH